MKDKNKRHKAAKKASGETVKNEDQRRRQDETDQPPALEETDFGGLPRRDLKKNLGGCG